MSSNNYMEVAGRIHHSIKNHIQTIFGLLELYSLHSENESFEKGIELSLSKFQLLSSVLSCFEDKPRCELSELMETLLLSNGITLENISIENNLSFDMDQGIRLLIAIGEVFDHLSECSCNALQDLTFKATKSKIIIRKPGGCEVKKKFRLQLTDILLSQIDASFIVKEDTSNCSYEIQFK